MTYERIPSLNLASDLLMIFIVSRISNNEIKPTSGYPLPNGATRFIQLQKANKLWHTRLTIQEVSILSISINVNVIKN